MTAMGHEEPFLPLKLSGRCGSRKRSLAAMVSRRQVNEPSARLFGNSILRCLAHPAVQQDAARDCVLELLAVVIGGRLLPALVKRDGFTRRYIQRSRFASPF
jgi:hypothetical protein